MTIEALNPSQKERIAEYRDAQIEISRSTGPARYEVAAAAARRMLEVSEIELDPDHRIEFAPNPIAAAVMGNQISGCKNTLFQSASYGGSSARNNFFVEVAGVKLTPELEERRNLLTEFVGSCGGAYFSPKVTIIYDRPSRLSLVAVGDSHVLHSEDGPALAWGRDAQGNYSASAEGSYALYYWQGTKIPEHWIMDKPVTAEAMKARAEEVLGTANQEVLRAGCEILGWIPVLEALGMKVLDEDPNPAFGRLVTVDLPEAPNSKFLVAECGTGRTIAVPADPDATTAVGAGAKSYGVPVSLYKKLKHRT